MAAPGDCCRRLDAQQSADPSSPFFVVGWRFWVRGRPPAAWERQPRKPKRSTRHGLLQRLEQRRDGCGGRDLILLQLRCTLPAISCLLVLPGGDRRKQQQEQPATVAPLRRNSPSRRNSTFICCVATESCRKSLDPDCCPSSFPAEWAAGVWWGKDVFVGEGTVPSASSQLSPLPQPSRRLAAMTGAPAAAAVAGMPPRSPEIRSPRPLAAAAAAAPPPPTSSSEAAAAPRVGGCCSTRAPPPPRCSRRGRRSETSSRRRARRQLRRRRWHLLL